MLVGVVVYFLASKPDTSDFFGGLDVLKVIGVVDDPALCVIPYEGETDF